MAVVRGRVTTREGAPLAAVRVKSIDKPQFGSTLTRTDGTFDLAVNGGGTTTLDFQRASFLPVQRTIAVPWQAYVFAPDVVMIGVDAASTVVDLSSSTPIQVVRGSVITDGEGTRQSILLVPAGTSATVVHSDGRTEPMSLLTIRATEYTVGEAGPRAMPAQLPPTSGYTYAVELNADEAVAAGARSVTSSQPLVHYLDNFLEFPVGEILPVGYYDRQEGHWLPSGNGRVIRILSISGSMAEVDIDGSGNPASAVDLQGLGITDNERIELASLYPANKTLWRVLIDHCAAHRITSDLA